MKISISVILITVVFAFAGICDIAAQKTKTIILIRHAEKDVSETADKNDPVLTTVGSQRAQRLLEKIGRYKPGAIYSTAYKRTQATVEPLANHRKLKIMTYDARKQNELVDEIMKSKTKRFVVVGHSNTIPGLANLLIKKDIFKNLEDSEHSVIWLIKLQDGKVEKMQILEY